MPPTIVVEGQLTLPDNAVAILQNLFAGCRQVIVKREFTGNLSGSRVFLVQPITPSGAPLPVVVKFAARSLIEKEWHAYQQVHQMLYGMVEVQDKYVPQEGSWGALRYPLQGGGHFQVTSLYEYYHYAETPDVLNVLRRLFVMLGSVHNQHQSELAFHWCADYDRVLPVNFLIDIASPPLDVQVQTLSADADQRPDVQPGDWVRLEGFAVTKVDLRNGTVTLNLPAREGVSDAFRVRLQSAESPRSYQAGEIVNGIEGRVRATRRSQLQAACQSIVGIELDRDALPLTLSHSFTLPNPLQKLPALLYQHSPVHTSLIHGDLNLNNILIDPKIGQVSLIDVAEARHGHILHDFLRLETEIVTHVLSRTLHEHRLEPGPTLFELYGQVHCTAFERDALTLPSVAPHLQKPFEVLAALRHAAYRHFYTGSPVEYYQGLLLYLVGALRFANLDRKPTAPLPKQAAFWAAATVAWLLDNAPACRRVASSPWDADPPSAQLVTYEPEVKVRRKDSDYLSDVSCGMPLYLGDIVSTYVGAEALVLCQRNTLFTVPPERNQHIDCRKIPQERVLAQLPLRYQPSTPRLLNEFSSNVELHRDEATPLLLNPRNTRITEVRPVFRWHAVTDAKGYRLSLRAPGGRLWERETGATTLVYPTDAPPLEQGCGYTVELEVLGSRIAPELTYIAVLDAEATAQVQAQESAMRALPLDNAGTAYLLSLLYEERQLWAAAQRQLALLEQLESQAAPWLWLRLGNLDLRMGMYTQAERRYRQVLECATFPHRDSAPASARAGLACALYALGDEESLPAQIEALGDDAGPMMAQWLNTHFTFSPAKKPVFQGPLDLFRYARFLAEEIAGHLREEIRHIPNQFLEQLQAMQAYALNPSHAAATLGSDKFYAMEILAAAYLTTCTLSEHLTIEDLKPRAQGANLVPILEPYAFQVARDKLGLPPERAADFARRYAKLVAESSDALWRWIESQET